MLERKIIGSCLTLITSALDSYGVDSRKFFSDRGISLETALNPGHRISLVAVNHFWRDAIEETGVQTFGLEAGSFVTPNTLSALGMAMWSACTLKDQLECFIRYLHIVGDASKMEIEELDDVLISSSCLHKDEEGQNFISDCAQDAIVAVIHTMRRTTYSRDFSPLKVELNRSQPDNPEVYEAFFGCPVTFGQPFIRIHIRMEDAIAPIPGTCEHVANATTQLLEDYLVKTESTDNIVGQMREVLTILLPQGRATMEQVAGQLHTSKRTFHRKLEEQGTTFREQIEEFRRELAFQYMSQDELSLGDISFLLGFSSNSNFTRAFKRWTGKTPQYFRGCDSVLEIESSKQIKRPH